MRISVICATIGPLSQVDQLIRSLLLSLARVRSTISLEFILIDQSDEEAGHLFPTSDQFNLVHIRNPTRGLSRNRNIGLSRATGEWVLLMDSDCLVESSYFTTFLELRQTHPHVNHFMGQIRETNSGSPLFRSWPRKTCNIPNYKVWYFATSVNNIFKIPSMKIRFDEFFGLGATYGSCEDIDFFLRLKSVRLYSQDLITFHPQLSITKLDRKKLNSYSFGYGALCAKHALPLGLVMLLLSLIKKARDVVLAKTEPADLVNALAYRAKGFMAYFFAHIRGRHG